jgi:hypothetical protein
VLLVLALGVPVLAVPVLSAVVADGVPGPAGALWAQPDRASPIASAAVSVAVIPDVVVRADRRIVPPRSSCGRARAIERRRTC